MHDSCFDAICVRPASCGCFAQSCAAAIKSPKHLVFLWSAISAAVGGHKVDQFGMLGGVSLQAVKSLRHQISEDSTEALQTAADAIFAYFCADPGVKSRKLSRPRLAEKACRKTPASLSRAGDQGVR